MDSYIILIVNIIGYLLSRNPLNALKSKCLCWARHLVGGRCCRGHFYEDDQAKAVVVVTHGLTMRLILMQLFHWSPNTFHTVWSLLRSFQNDVIIDIVSNIITYMNGYIYIHICKI